MELKLRLLQTNAVNSLMVKLLMKCVIIIWNITVRNGMILYKNLQLQSQGTVKSNSSNSNIKSHLKVVHILKFDQIINRLPVTLQLAY